MGKERSKLGPSKDNQDGTEVGMHGGVGSAVSEDDDVLGEPGWRDLRRGRSWMNGTYNFHLPLRPPQYRDRIKLIRDVFDLR